MKICLVVFDVANPRGFNETASAHVKLPMYSVKLLQDAGHTVHLITNNFDDDSTLPFYSPGDALTIHQTVDGRHLEKTKDMPSGVMTGIQPFKIIKQFFQIKKITDTENYDVVHFFGGGAMALFAGCFMLIGGKAPAILTFLTNNMPTRFWFINKHFFKKIPVVVTSTKFMKNKMQMAGLEAKFVGHGITRDITNEIGDAAVDKPHRVLFWRDPSVENGADICVQVYKQLAPKFPHINFDFAIRTHWAPVPGINELAEQYPNVNVHQFPYKNGVSLAKLMAESVCVLLPFRELSCHPQFAVIESMLSRAPVVTTTVDSNTELINNGHNGYLVNAGDVEGTVAAVELLLTDREKAATIGEQAADDILAQWNWDSYLDGITEVYKQAIK